MLSAIWHHLYNLKNMKKIHGCFSRFSNCTNGTQLSKASEIIKTDKETAKVLNKTFFNIARDLNTP